jgi:hypothetical protein
MRKSKRAMSAISQVAMLCHALLSGLRIELTAKEAPGRIKDT